MSKFRKPIKQLIIDSLGLEDITVADIGSEDPLFGDEGFGSGFRRRAGTRFGSAKKPSASSSTAKNDNLRENFANVKTLAEFVKSRQA